MSNVWLESKLEFIDWLFIEKYTNRFKLIPIYNEDYQNSLFSDFENDFKIFNISNDEIKALFVSIIKYINS